MEEFPGNTNKGKDEKKQAPKAERPKIEKVVKEGEAVKLKKSFGSRFKEVFLGGDARSTTRYITTDVLLPALRNLILDSTTKGMERLIYGENRRTPRRGGEEYGRPRIDYRSPISRYAGRPGPMLPDQPPLANRPSRASEDIVLTDREEADAVIESLTDIIDQYTVASIADLHELLGWPTTYVDNKWGWHNLAHAQVRQIREGYLLDLPRAEPI
jgi:hypothetical protein